MLALAHAHASPYCRVSKVSFFGILGHRYLSRTLIKFTILRNYLASFLVRGDGLLSHISYITCKFTIQRVYVCLDYLSQN